MTEAEPIGPADEHPSMEQLLEDQSCTPPRRGEIRRGVVIAVSPSQVVLDIQAKREGVVPERELERLDPEVKDQITVGAELPVYVINPEDEEGRMIVSIARGLVQADWDQALELLETQGIWEGRVTGHNRGGLLVEFGRLRGFIPSSHLVSFPRSIPPDERIRRLSEMSGRRLGLRVIEVDQDRNRLVLSERAAHREWREQQQERYLAELKENTVIHGRVSSVQDFGVFVDLGAIEGLIHISELSWTRVKHPSEVLRAGDEVDVRILRVDRDRKRVSLSLRQMQGDPWEQIEERFTLGQLITGRVTRIVSYGAFVEVEEGIEGLLHISELSDDKPASPRDVIEEDEVLPLRIIRIDSARRRLGLSFRRVTTAEWEEWRASRMHVEELPGEALEEIPIVEPEKTTAEPGAEVQPVREAMPVQVEARAEIPAQEGEAVETAAVAAAMAAEVPTEEAAWEAAGEEIPSTEPEVAAGVLSEEAAEEAAGEEIPSIEPEVAAGVLSEETAEEAAGEETPSTEPEVTAEVLSEEAALEAAGEEIPSTEPEAAEDRESTEEGPE